MEYLCKTCQKTKKATDFYKDKTYKSGLGLYACKDCWDKKRKRRRQYFWANNKEKYLYNYRARGALQYAIKTGKIKKKPCEVCQTTEKIHGHHEDYSKPLNVIWLCQLHHSEHHTNSTK